MDRRLIVGLGNPGPPYAHNRHNVGYWCINRLSRLHGVELKARRLASIGEGEIASQRVLLLKPRTFVNHSGQAVQAALRNLHLSPQAVLVVCDDLDLPPGKLRLRPSGGHGGHNGLKSIVAALGTLDFPRLRIGIGRPQVGGQPVWDRDIIALWVLSDPPPQEAMLLQEATARAAEAVEFLLKHGLEAAANRYNL